MPFERIWISMVGLFCSFAVRNEVTYAARIHIQSKWFWNGFSHVSPERTNICARHRDNTLANILLTKFLREFRKWENELGRGWRWGVGRWWGLGVCGAGGADEKWLEIARNSSKHCCSSQSTTNVHRNHQSGFIEAISLSSSGPAEPNDCNASSHFSVLLWKSFFDCFRLVSISKCLHRFSLLFISTRRITFAWMVCSPRDGKKGFLHVSTVKCLKQNEFHDN